MIGVGIDFGTTNSVVAHYDGKSARPLLNEENQPHPSVVWYNGERVIVGREAKAHFNTYESRAEHTFKKSVKRDLGADRYLDVLGRRMPAWEVAADIFQFLRRHAEGTLKEVRECVVTVPVGFNDRQRADVRRAASRAGLYIKTFVHEPFAAFVAYMDRQRAGTAEWDEIRNVLVFDWGGGTLDITLVSVRDGALFEQGTGDMPDRAGDDFDRYVQEHLVQRFLNRHGLSKETFSLRPAVKDRLVLEAERRKIELSDATEAVASVAGFHRDGSGQYDLTETVNRRTFEELIDADVAKAMDRVDQTLNLAGVTHMEVDRVLMIGGTSLVPRVGDELRRRFDRSRVISVENAPTIIAEGASIVAHHDWKPYLVYPLYVILSDGTPYPVFEAGTTLWALQAQPREVTFFCTDHRDGQARLVLAEGGRGNTLTTKCVLPIPVSTRLEHNRAEKVVVSFAFDENLVLTVSGRGSVAGQPAQARIHKLCIGLRTR